MKASEIKQNPPRIILWGDSGCGKTALAATLGARAQLMDLDNGLLTLAKLNDKFTADRLNVDVKPFRESRPHLKANMFSDFRAHALSVYNDVTSKKFPFDAVIVDSLTALADAALNQVLYNSGQLSSPPQRQHWGAAFMEIKSVLNILLSLPIVVIVIGHEEIKSYGPEKARIEKLGLALSGKNLSAQICRQFDEIWYLRSRPAGGGKLKFTIQTINDERISAKSRANIPTDTNADIGMGELIKMTGYNWPVEASSRTST